jgi:RNA polymerase sigma-70 factor (ECF subfamily)
VNELDRLCRAHWGRLLAALIRVLGDFDLAEESLQEAFELAVTTWPTAPPRNPLGWLYGTARHRAIDRVRRGQRLAQMLPELAPPETEPYGPPPNAEENGIPDERLRLIFTCCHPALPEEAQVALTLRTLCGLRTEEVSHAFLVPLATMAQRLVRAKAKIRDARIPYAVPEADELAERLAPVMSVLYLVFNEGYAATQGRDLVKQELCAEAISLARMLQGLLAPCPPDVEALLALMLLQDARRDARRDARGDLVLLADQDRARWDQAQIAEGLQLVEGALRRAPPSAYAIEAAIAAVHAEARSASQTDWPQIVRLYDLLYSLHPSPVVALNRGVAVAMVEGPAAGLEWIDGLSGALDGYHLFHAARADLLAQLGRPADARRAYERALQLALNESERRFLTRRCAALGDVEGAPKKPPDTRTV